jgi:DNA primase
MPLICFKTAKRLIPLAKVLSILGYRYPLQKWPKCSGPCPFRCSFNNRAASFDLRNGGWHCFGCRKSGNQLELYAMATGKPLHEATVELCGKAGVEPPYLEADPRPCLREPHSSNRSN